MTFDDLVLELWDGNATSTASAILKRLKVNATASAVLLSVVATRVTDHVRADVRTVEYQVAAGGGITSAHGRSLLSAHGFYVGDGKYVTWGAATLDDHRNRIAYLVAKRNGLTVTITRHEEAIAEIIAHGVDCLDQIEACA